MSGDFAVPVLNLTLKQLETFVWVADLGSFRRAAERLNTTQPNVSSRIATLETTLDVALLERDAGSVRLTAKGRELLEHARRVLRSAENLIEAADGATLFEGTLRLGVAEMIVHTWLRDFLRAYKDRYPNVLIELTVDLSVNLERELAERTIDIAFQSGPFERRISGSQSLGTYPIIWVAAPQIGLPQESSVAIEDLAKLPILTHARDTRPYQEVAAHFAARPDLRVRLVPSSHLAACLHMTIDGLGVAALLAPMVAAEIASGQLLPVDYDWVPTSLDFFARYDASASSHLIEKAAELAGTVSQRFAEHYANGVKE